MLIYRGMGQATHCALLHTTSSFFDQVRKRDIGKVHGTLHCKQVEKEQLKKYKDGFVNFVQMKWREITFARLPYHISDTGELWSPIRNKTLKGKSLAPGSPWVSYDLYIKGVGRKAVLRNRLVYFFFVYYPKFLKKQKEAPSWENFLRMPMIIHQDGNRSNDARTNLLPYIRKEELSRWKGLFPLKHTTRVNTNHAPIIEKLGKGEEVRKMLQAGANYREIAAKINVSEMAVFRFAISKGFRERKAVRVLTQKEKQYILSKWGKTTQKSIAQKLGVSETQVSRFLKRYREKAAARLPDE